MVECFGGHPFDFAVAEVKADHLGTITGVATNAIFPVYFSLLKRLVDLLEGQINDPLPGRTLFTSNPFSRHAVLVH